MTEAASSSSDDEAPPATSPADALPAVAAAVASSSTAATPRRLYGTKGSSRAVTPRGNALGAEEVGSTDTRTLGGK